MRRSDLCDAVVYNFPPQTFEKEFAEVNGWDDLRLVEVASDLTSPFKDRYLAHWRMYGPKFGCATSGNAKSDPLLSLKFYEAVKLPPLLQYIAYEGYRRCGEALGIPIPFLWQWMTCSKEAWTAPDPFENDRDSIVDNMLAATFDKHTWQGKGAMKRFLSSCKPVKSWLNQNCTGDEFAALERAVFYAEGALLRPRLFFDGARQFYDHVLTAKLCRTASRSLIAATSSTSSSRPTSTSSMRCAAAKDENAHIVAPALVLPVGWLLEQGRGLYCYAQFVLKLVDEGCLSDPKNMAVLVALLLMDDVKDDKPDTNGALAVWRVEESRWQDAAGKMQSRAVLLGF